MGLVELKDNVIKTHKCPICNKISEETKYKPFCSKRCADVDLGNWLNGSYAVPAQDLDESDYEELERVYINSDEE